MPEFLNPFSGVVPRKLTKEELIRAIRLNIAAEHEAVHLYMAHADATDDQFARKVLTDIANEEREHIGNSWSCSDAWRPMRPSTSMRGGAKWSKWQKAAKARSHGTIGAAQSEAGGSACCGSDTSARHAPMC